MCLLISFVMDKLPFPCTINELVLVVLGQFMELLTSRIFLHSPVVNTLYPSSTKIHCPPPSQLHVDLVHVFTEPLLLVG